MFSTIFLSCCQTTTRQYRTTVAYLCPANTSLPQIISSNFSLDYKKQNGMVYNVTALCDIDRYDQAKKSAFSFLEIAS